jgi:hypothetical protein
MQGRQLVLVGVIAVIIILAFYIWIARPVVVLPTVTVPLSPTYGIGLVQKQLHVNELSVRVRTDGKLILNGDGQELAHVSYDLVSLKNAADLAQKTSLGPDALTGLAVFLNVFPQVTWNLYFTSLSAFYGLPVEITIRFIPT